MRRVAAGLAVVIALGLAACGDGTKSLSKDEFVAQATAICERAEKRTEDIAEDLPQPTGDGELTGEQLQESVELAAPIIDDTFAELDDLAAPDDLAERFDKLVADGQAASTKLKEAADSPASIQEYLENNDDAFAGIDERFDDLGLTQCGSNE